MVYFPVKSDPIDTQMAEWINHEADRSKLRIMFMRDSEGVYEFGNRKVSVKVESGKIKVRVGGGYISIDKFIEQFTPSELERLNTKDPYRRFAEKVVV